MVLAYLENATKTSQYGWLRSARTVIGNLRSFDNVSDWFHSTSLGRAVGGGNVGSNRADSKFKDFEAANRDSSDRRARPLNLKLEQFVQTLTSTQHRSFPPVSYTHLTLPTICSV
eukprot:886430-Rhodomonas_salina.2